MQIKNVSTKIKSSLVYCGIQDLNSKVSQMSFNREKGNFSESWVKNNTYKKNAA